MIYLFTALYCEAAVFIRQLQLEKNLENTWFQEFTNETLGIRLTITGVGGIAAAAAVGSICTKYKPGGEDVLLNIGTCAHKEGSSGIFVCNKLIEQTTGKTFYPDILYSHDFAEETIVTGMLPQNCERNGAGTSVMVLDGNLYDMEAAALYQAGSYFFGPHQMVFLKVVSDDGRAKEISGKQVEDLMESCKDRLFDFIKQLSVMFHENVRKKGCARQDMELMTERLCRDMHCSKAMRDLLEQHIRYLSLSGTDLSSVIQNMYREGLLPCRDKREGKQCFEELKRRLL